MQAQKNEAFKKASLYPEGEEKEKFIKRELVQIRKSFERNKRETASYFILVAYDQQSNKARIFYINSQRQIEDPKGHQEIGSGMDGANLYLVSKLQGTDTRKLSEIELAFYVVNAYSLSTVNQGVGGTPRIARISKNGCNMLPTERTIALTNLSGAYLAEFPGSDLSTNIMREHIKEIMDAENPNYDAIAEKLRLNNDTLTTMCIPYSSWQERANRILFRETEN